MTITVPAVVWALSPDVSVHADFWRPWPGQFSVDVDGAEVLAGFDDAHVDDMIECGWIIGGYGNSDGRAWFERAASADTPLGHALSGVRREVGAPRSPRPAHSSVPWIALSRSEAFAWTHAHRYPVLVSSLLWWRMSEENPAASVPVGESDIVKEVAGALNLAGEGPGTPVDLACSGARAQILNVHAGAAAISRAEAGDTVAEVLCDTAEYLYLPGGGEPTMSVARALAYIDAGIDVEEARRFERDATAPDEALHALGALRA